MTNLLTPLFNKIENKKYFEGCYFKQCNENFLIAFIPSISIDEKGGKECFIQVITGETSHCFSFPYKDFCFDKKNNVIKIGENCFSEKGIKVHLFDETMKISAKLTFENFTPLKSHIMGPFKFLPFMQCKHEILSMKHQVFGSVLINDKTYNFNNSVGYIEKDFGSSFPSQYSWIQCNAFKDSCLFFSIAKIPFLGFTFKGYICSLLYKGKEYRFATYNFAKILECTLFDKKINNTSPFVIIKKGNLQLKIIVNQEKSQSLIAPNNGKMNVEIFECPIANVRIELKQRGKIILSSSSSMASCEIFS